MGGDSAWGWPDSRVEYDSEYRRKYCWSVEAHRWVNTGMRRTWCKHCDATAELDPMTGVVTVLPPKEENDNIEKGRE